MRRDHLNAVVSQLLIQRIAVVGAIADQILRLGFDHVEVEAAAEDMLASAQWRTVSWRSGTKGRLKARFAAVRVRTADGPPQRIWDKVQQHLPGDEAWLIGEQGQSESQWPLFDRLAHSGKRRSDGTAS